MIIKSLKRINEVDTNINTDDIKKISEQPGILRKVAGVISDHPYLAAGTVAGIIGLAALQKRRKTEQPQQY